MEKESYGKISQRTYAFWALDIPAEIKLLTYHFMEELHFMTDLDGDKGRLI